MVLQKNGLRRCRAGFTLIELLIGLSILTTLGMLFLPAIQSARESSRLASCRNHISQLSKGMLQHEHFQGYFPSAGWSPSWLGVADRTGDSAQPGGWAYGILPYIDETATRNLVANVPAGGANAAYAKLAAAPLPMFSCPSRRSSQALPLVDTSFQGQGGTVVLTRATRSDFAVNSGSGGSETAGFDGLCPSLGLYASAISAAAGGSASGNGNGKGKGSSQTSGNSKKISICHAPPGNPSKGNSLSIAISGLNGHQNHPGDRLGACDTCDDPVESILSSPASLSEGDAWRKMPLSERLVNLGDMGIPDIVMDGMAGRMTRLQAASVYDGLSNTYLIGEKQVASDTYRTGTDDGDSAPLLAGYSSNTSRWASVPPAADERLVTKTDARAFGSGHRGGWNMAYADGMVRTMSFEIDAKVHQQLSSRNGITRGEMAGIPPAR
jgi:prepilin-type N-terminal cleavage/methylation domain-containing protein